MNDWTGVHGRVWSTLSRDGKGRRYRTWHYAVTRADGRVVLYDNTGKFQLILNSALVRVEALRHMVIAGHKLKPYKGDIG